jgi:hypothetical protein
MAQPAMARNVKVIATSTVIAVRAVSKLYAALAVVVILLVTIQAAPASRPCVNQGPRVSLIVTMAASVKMSIALEPRVVSIAKMAAASALP